MAERRTPRGAGRRPGARPGPRLTPASRGRSARPGGATARGGAAARDTAPSTPATGRQRPRLTGRALVLALVVGVLAVSYASSLRAFLDQRERIVALKTAIAERAADIDRLEREKRRWADDAYVKAQARERFGYLMPGETGYQVIDEDGQPLSPHAELSDPDDVLPTPVPTAWWETAWESVELAGRPPRRRTPAEEIQPPEPAAEGRR